MDDHRRDDHKDRFDHLHHAPSKEDLPEKQQIQLNLYSKQLDFFAFENHMRQIMHTVLEPISSKLSDNRLSVDLLRKDFEISERIVSNLEEIVLNKQKKNNLTVFDKLYNKLADIASESHERDEELKKKLDILTIRVSQNEENIFTLLAQNQRIESHIHIALKDVSTVQTETQQFKEKVETILKEETDQVNQRWAQIRLRVKQINDLVNDVQKQQNFAQDDISRQSNMLISHQTYIEAMNRRITLNEQIKLDEKTFQQNEKMIDQRLKELNNKCIDVMNNLKSTDNYLEKYLPFNVFCQLFEVLRLTLDQNHIKRVKDYEEFRLKELYDIILTDQGDTKTTFNKKYVIQPVGYNFDELKSNETKLQSKSKRFIMGRPSLSSSIKLDDEGNPIPDPIRQPGKNSFYGMGARFQQKKKNPRKKNDSLPELTRASQSMKEQRPEPMTAKDLKNSPLKTLVEDPKGEDFSQITFSDEEEEVDVEVDERMNDAIEDLLANMHEDNSSLGIKNLDYLKKKLFDPEIELIMKKVDTKIIEMNQKFEEERKKFLVDYQIINSHKNSVIETFALEIDGFNKKMAEHQTNLQSGIQKFQIQIDKLQNMYNYLSIKIENVRAKSQGPSGSSTSHSVYHTQMRNNMTEIKSRNLHSSTLITDHGNRTNQTNASTRISNYNVTSALDQIKSYNNQNLYIQGGQVITSSDSLNQTVHVGGKEDVHLHSQNVFQTAENRPRTAIIRPHKSKNKRMIVIPMNNSNNNNKQDASLQNSLIL
ncbi:UNKNOWN [Stylonychia lemnae]|uniref:Uncharacterized protein n=1 Tax=Stylonychia lemnae TaxID=5949 RepID=A0A077ZX67_STYLE|nr:UNKNOWN [Stylonychia lemnae]|eukprot:CDW74166.1 UNKNOWN [Stylonychia lemnae]